MGRKLFLKYLTQSGLVILAALSAYSHQAAQQPGIAALSPRDIPRAETNTGDALLNQSFSFERPVDPGENGKDRPLNLYWQDGELRAAQSRSFPLLTYPGSEQTVSLKAIEPMEAYPKYRTPLSPEFFKFMGIEFRFDLEEPKRIARLGPE